MKNILVIADPAGGEQVAFNRALELAKPTLANVHVVSFCFESLGEGQLLSFDKPATLDVKQLIIDHVASQWIDFIQDRPLSTRVTHEVAWAKYIHLWVLEHCKQVQYDLIVKTGHRSESPLHTPTDWLLLRESSVPVYLVSDVGFKPGRAVLAALDLDAIQAEEVELNNRILQAASQLALQTQSELHCCYTVTVPQVLKDLDVLDASAVTEKREQEVREDAAQKWLELYDLDQSALHIKEGRPWHVVNYFARKLKANTVVAGSMNRTKWLKSKLLGSTAERIIHHAVSDVLIV